VQGAKPLQVLAKSEVEDVRKKRKLFNELMEGFDALAEQRAGKRTLRTHAVKHKPAPKAV
jgi:hypothetical protein